MPKIEECIGKDSLIVKNDVDYLSSSIIAIFESRIKDIMINMCYTTAGDNIEDTNACDIIEKDILDLLWLKFQFSETVEYHKSKYTYVDANMES